MSPISPLRTMRAFVVRMGGLFAGRRQDRELAEEFESHLEMQIEDNLRAGMTPAEARRDALLKTGGLSLAQENYRNRRGLPFIDNTLRDLQYAGRLLRRSPGFTAVAVLSLAFGIGANTSIFTIVNAVMLRSLPIEDPSRLVQIKQGENTDLTNPIWEQIRDHQTAFSGVLATSEDRFDLSDGGESHFAQGVWASGDYFRVLGVPALRGRVFNTYDDRRGAPALAVISYSFWQRRFAGDPAVVGKTIRLNRHPFEIIGVTPPWFTGLNVDRGFEVAIPIACEPILHTDGSALDARSTWWLTLLGRLRPGESVAQAAVRMKQFAPQVYQATLPTHWLPNDLEEYLRNSLDLSPAAGGFSQTGTHYRGALFLLMAIVGLVLLIACANVANLLMARASARQREIAVRMAIGASRARIVRQLLTESLLLSLLGAAFGFLLALAGSRLLLRLISTASSPLDIDIAPDLRVFGFTIAATLLTALLFGLAPAMRATRIELEQALKENARSAVAGASRFNLGKALIVGQVALSLVLLVGSGLFLGTLRNLLTIDPGFNRQNLLVIGADFQQASVAKSQRVRVYRDILERLRAIPGVVSASSSMHVPISGSTTNGFVRPEGFTPANLMDSIAFFNRVSPGYFKTWRTPILLGRDFDLHDDAAAQKVLIINESAARHFFGSLNVVGKTIGVERPPDEQTERPGTDLFEVIGVVKDAKYLKLDEEPVRTIYMSAAQDTDQWPNINYEVRSNGSVERLIPSIRAAIAGVNRGAALNFSNFETQVGDSLLRPRVVALLSTAFGVLALILAMVGLYGVTSYSVARRKSEIGLRMALGEQRQSVTWLMLRDILVLLTIGMGVGLAASLAAGRLVASLLYGIRPSDPVQLIGALLVLAAATAAAAYLPARRAARLDPMAALREE
jgi:putative ABC transport system permease protein